jgi:hypothetical protein
MAVPPLNDTTRYPKMAHWFDPVLLLKLLNNVLLSSIFGQYADRRLIIAALDTVPLDEHVKRAEAFRHRLTADKDGSVWIDWVADLGDGFDSTYAMATLLSREKLMVGDSTLPRGQALIMGGDEVYRVSTKPTASRTVRRLGRSSRNRGGRDPRATRRRGGGCMATVGRKPFRRWACPVAG